MPISINPVQVSGVSFQKTTSEEKSKKNKTEKFVLGGLAALGVAGVVYLVLRKKKAASKAAKDIIGVKPDLKNMTDAEKENLIKELQAKTDNPEVKEEIRKLVENGEWNNL